MRMRCTRDNIFTMMLTEKDKHEGTSLAAGHEASSVARRGWTSKVLMVAALSLVAFVTLRLHPTFLTSQPSLSPQSKGNSTQDDPWTTIPSSKTLEWHPCYSSQYTCARLDLPMDWLSPSAMPTERVVLAIIRLHATNNTDYGGPIFFNPGGPGGSGVAAVLDHGHLLQTVVGKNHDLISFDPRGVGASLPRIECWGGDESSRTLWDLKTAETDVLGAVHEAYARAEAMSLVCLNAMGGEDGILAHSSTASHARDMLAILDGMGEDKLSYWGFSYGTILGGVFASMFPDRVGRMVSDGNVDYEEWFGDENSRINSPRDANQVMEAFFTTCHAAGRDRCDFWAQTPAEVKTRFETLLANLTTSPVVVTNMASLTSSVGPAIPEVITAHTIIRLLTSVLYQPLLAFPPLATSLAALEERNGLPLYTSFLSFSSPSTTICANPNLPIVPTPDTADAFSAVFCSDAEPFSASPEEYQRYASTLVNMSTYTGAELSLGRLSCNGRSSVRDAYRFSGPFGRNATAGVPPILFIANRLDNITPLAAARNNSAVFPGSRVLVQESCGHTSLAAPSGCTAAWVRRYFATGEMPEEGSVCQGDLQPFGDVVKLAGVGDVVDEAANAVRELSLRRWRWMLGSGGRW